MSKQRSQIQRSLPSTALVALLVVAGCGSSTAAPPSTAQSAAGSAIPSVAPVAPTAAAKASASPVAAAAPSAPAVAVTVVPSKGPEAAFVKLWEKSGPTPDRPCTAQPKIDPKGRIWVINGWDSEFWIFRPDGTIVETWGKEGTGNGQFDFKYLGHDDAIGGVAFAPDGSFYTFESGNLRVQQFDADRRFVRSWGGFGSADGKFAKPTAIATDRAGHVYVADGSRGDVQVFDADGTYLRTVAKGHAGPYGFAYMAVDPAGDVWVNDPPMLRKFSPDGVELATYDMTAFGGDAAPTVIDQAGHLFATAFVNDTPETMVEFDTDGTVLHAWPALGEMVALDGKGTAYSTTACQSPYLTASKMPTD